MVNFSPGRGSEQEGTRPALVIQNDVGNRFALTTIVAAVTSTSKIYPVTTVRASSAGSACYRQSASPSSMPQSVSASTSGSSGGERHGAASFLARGILLYVAPPWSSTGVQRATMPASA